MSGLMSTHLSRRDLLDRFIDSNPVAWRRFMEQFQEDHATKYLLNVEATQFPIGKTEKTLSRVALLNATRLHQLNNNDDDETHTISIIVSSCSLAETEQWRIRCKNKFGRDLNIATISSKESNTRGGSGRTMSNFISSLTLLTKNIYQCIVDVLSFAKNI